MRGPITPRTHGVLTLLLLLLALLTGLVGIALVAVLPAVLYALIIAAGLPLVIYLFCGKCVCRGDRCLMVYPGRLSVRLPDRRGEAYTTADGAGILGTLVLLAVFPLVLALADDAALRALRRARAGRARGGDARRLQSLRELPLPGEPVVPWEGPDDGRVSGRDDAYQTPGTTRERTRAAYSGYPGSSARRTRSSRPARRSRTAAARPDAMSAQSDPRISGIASSMTMMPR